MKGTVRMKITARGNEERIRTAVNLKGVDTPGKIRILKSFLKALEISALEASLFISLIQTEAKMKEEEAHHE